MSDINGKGYGDSHDWAKLVTAQVQSWGRKETLYKCRRCDVLFSHFYDETPDIFEAIEKAGVQDECPMPNFPKISN